MLTPASQIALLGFGPRAAHIARTLAPRGQALRAFDATARHAHIEAAGVDVAPDLATALRGARLVIVEQAALLTQLPQMLRPGQVLIDLAGDEAAYAELAARAHAAQVSCLAGHLHVDSAGTPLLQLGGARAETVATALNALGLPTRLAGVEDTVTARLASVTPAPAPLPLRRAELP